MARSLEEIAEDRAKLSSPDEELYFFDINKMGIIALKTKNKYGEADLTILKNEQAVMESVYNILLTQPGERVMNPPFGCDLDQYLFEPIDDITAARIVQTVAESIIAYEPRVIDLDVFVTPDPDDQTFVIDIYLTLNTVKETVQLTTTLEKVR